MDCEEDEGGGISIRREFSFLPFSFRTLNVFPKRPADVAILYASCKTGRAPRLLSFEQRATGSNLSIRTSVLGATVMTVWDLVLAPCWMYGEGNGAWATRRTGGNGLCACGLSFRK